MNFFNYASWVAMGYSYSLRYADRLDAYLFGYEV